MFAPAVTSAETLADAMSGAYNTSGLLEQNRALLRAADEDVSIAVSALRPVIDWTASFSASRTDRQISDVGTLTNTQPFFTGLTLDLLLYDGGATRLGVDAAKQTVLATRQSLVSIEQAVLIRSVAAYMNVLLQAENVLLRENNVRLLTEELRATQDRFEVGEVTRTDVALSESRRAAARSGLASARGGLVNARAEFVNAVGRDASSSLQLPSLPAAPASIDAAVAVAVRNHPDILASQYRVATADLLIEQANKSVGPSARFTSNVGVTESTIDSDHTYTGSVGLSFRQPIYAGGRVNAQIRRAQNNSAGARGALLSVRRDVVQSVENAIARLRVANANLDATAERIRAAQVAFDGIREEAKLGARTTIDVLTAEQDLLDAKTEEISATAEKYVAAYQVLQAQGLLTAERLGLPVKIYDPTTYYNIAKDAPARMSKQSKELDRVLKALGKQ
jgi:outer membrane protein